MAANPLLERTRRDVPAVLTGDAVMQRLQDHCDLLNRMRWVQASGRPYFVGTRDGRPEVDRHEKRAD